MRDSRLSDWGMSGRGGQSARAVLASLCLVLGCVTPASAYLDPGTGSLLLQGLIAGFAATLATTAMYWRRLKKWFARRGRPESEEAQCKSIQDPPT